MQSDNPYQFGIAPIQRSKPVGALPRITWTLADVVMILISGIVSLAVWIISGGFFAFVFYHAAGSYGTRMQVIANVPGLLVLAMCVAIPGIVMLLTRNWIRRWKFSRHLRSPAELKIIVNDSHSKGPHK